MRGKVMSLVMPEKVLKLLIRQAPKFFKTVGIPFQFELLWMSLKLCRKFIADTGSMFFLFGFS
jgi:hypothetical protein